MQKNSFNYDELIACANGELFGEGNAKLPLPPMLMFDRITEIKQDIGEFKKGKVKTSTGREVNGYNLNLTEINPSPSASIAVAKLPSVLVSPRMSFIADHSLEPSSV